MITRQLNGERVVLLGWSRAILLQLAHPLVAAGVAEHSAFRDGPLAAALRLRQTVRAMLALAFGDRAATERTIARIQAIHRRVHGRLGEATGRFPAGHPYTAEDPALLLWVHATVVESVVITYDALVAPVSISDRDRYCEDAAPVAIALGARDEDVPRTWTALRRYLDAVYASGVLAVGADARRLSDAVLHPPLKAFSAPLAWVNRLLTTGLLPAGIREQYRLPWTRRRAGQLRIVVRLLRAARRALPSRLALWPEARGHTRAGQGTAPPSVRRAPRGDHAVLPPRVEPTHR